MSKGNFPERLSQQILVGIPLVARLGVPRHAAFSPDGALVATGSADASARIWDARSGDST